MAARCAECGGPTIWDDAAASEICTACGTLTDASQVILTSQDRPIDPTYCNDLWDPAAPSILKGRSNWALAGQGQEARDRKNAYTMANFIKSLAVSMNASGLSPRAINLFNQAKAIGHFRWGSRAKVVAGACLAVALRESNRPDSIQDLSFLLKCSPQLLSRTFISLTSTLQITSNPIDPSVYLGTLQTCLTTIVKEHQVDCGLTAPLIKSLESLSLRSATNVAASLCRILSRLCPPDGASKPSAASTACAIFMLSLEAEARTTLSSIGDLAKCLGARCHVGKGVVMTQYKSIQDQVATLIEKVPWLAKYESKGGRAKVAKRLIVARGLKDVIKFNEEIFHNVLLDDIHLESSPDEEVEDYKEAIDGSATEGSEAHAPLRTNDRPSKRRKIHHSLDEAARFLLDPFDVAGYNPAIQNPSHLQTKNPVFPLTSYVLSTSSLSNVSKRPPTRLQLLAAARGGSGEDAIQDDELFAEGELEGFLRSEDESEVLRRALGWDNDSDDESGSVPSAEADVESRKRRKPRNTKAAGSCKQSTEVVPTKKPRLNMDAFARLMQGSVLEEDDDTEEGNVGLLGLDLDPSFLGEDINLEDGEDAALASLILEPQRVTTANEDEIVVDAWRPASPSGSDNRYEQEYD